MIALALTLAICATLLWDPIVLAWGLWREIDGIMRMYD